MEPRQGILALIHGPILLLMPSHSLGREAWWTNTCNGLKFQFHLWHPLTTDFTSLSLLICQKEPPASWGLFIEG